jgi:hypothetical protein
MDIKLTNKQSKQLIKLLSDLGFTETPKNVLSLDLDENLFSASIEDLFNELRKNPKNELFVNVRPDLSEAIDEAVKNFKNFKNWYYSFNNTVKSVLDNKEDYMLILGFMAALSPNQGLDQNINTMVFAYAAYKYDVEKNRKKLSDLIDFYDTIGTFSKDLPEKLKDFKDLYFYQFAIRYPFKAAWDNIIRFLKFLRKYNFSPSIDNLVGEIKSGINVKTGSVDKSMFRGNKVFNFVLNLLDPDDNLTKIGDLLPATIDTWMIRFFYPNISDYDKNSVFDSPKKYILLQKLINVYAEKLGMKVNELQAIIWIFSIKNYKSSNKVTNAEMKDFKGSIDSSIEMIEKNNYAIKFNTEYIKQVVETLQKFKKHLN